MMTNPQARHPGRVAGLVLWDYDPDMPTTRLCFSPHQAGHFRGQAAARCPAGRART